MTETDHVRTQLASELDRHGERTGDSRFTRAAGVLRGKKAGRPKIDDSAALNMARALYETGVAKSIHDAAGRFQGRGWVASLRDRNKDHRSKGFLYR